MCKIIHARFFCCNYTNDYPLKQEYPVHLSFLFLFFMWNSESRVKLKYSRYAKA